MSGREPTDQKRWRAKRAAKRKAFVRDVDLSTIGMVFPIALLIGYFGGGLVGSWLGNEQLGSWIGLGLGLASGFYNLFKVAIMLQRREQRNDEGRLQQPTNEDRSSKK